MTSRRPAQALGQEAQGGAFARARIAEGQGEAAFAHLLFEAPAEALDRRGDPEGGDRDFGGEGVELQAVEGEEFFVHAEGVRVESSSLGR